MSTPQDPATKKAPPDPFDPGELVQIVANIRKDPCLCVPFLGAAVNVKDPDRSYDGMLIGRDLANEILSTKDFLFQGEPGDQANLAKVSLQYELRNTRSDLVSRLKYLIPDDDHQPSTLLRTLARLPFKLIVSTNYDRLMERALALEGKEEGKDFMTIVQPTGGWDLRADPSLMDKFNQWSQFKGLLLYKIHGSFRGKATRSAPADADGESNTKCPLIITEEDYIEFMTAMGHDDHERVGIPQCVRSRMQRQMFLFLGYGLEDWDIRALYKGMFDSLDTFNRRDSFAIQRNPKPLWQSFWNKRNVLVRNFDLYQFAEELHQAYFGSPLQWSPATPPSLAKAAEKI